MKIIKRYALAIEPEQEIDIPFNSDILSVKEINGKPYLFVMIDDGQRDINRKFLIVTDDKVIDQTINKTNFVGSFTYEQDKILHVFEK